MFKITDEIIKSIEEKVNKCLNDGTIERCSHLPAGSFVSIGELIVDISTGKASVIDPVKTYNEDDCDEDCDECENYEECDKFEKNTSGAWEAESGI